MSLLDRLTEGRFSAGFCDTPRILVVNGHPDPRPERYCAALCQAYEEGARDRGWDLRRVDVGSLGLLHDGDRGRIEEALDQIHWASRLLAVFPLWLDRPPALLKELFEQAARREATTASLLGGRPADCVITMEMPAFAHRAEARNPQEAGPLALAGFRCRRRTFIGSVGAISAAQRQQWLDRMRCSGRRPT